jgi:hypothetical protein
VPIVESSTKLPFDKPFLLGPTLPKLITEVVPKARATPRELVAMQGVYDPGLDPQHREWSSMLPRPRGCLLSKPPIPSDGHRTTETGRPKV